MNNNSVDILWIQDNDINILGGGEASMRIIIEGEKDKYKCAFINPGSASIGIDGVDVYALTNKKRLKLLIKNPVAFFVYIVKVGQKIRDINPQIIHCQSEGSLFILGFLRKLHLISPKIIIAQTDRGLCIALNKFYSFLYQQSLENINYLITTTEFNGRCWKEKNKNKKNINVKYKVIENTAGAIYESIDENKLPNNDYLTLGFAGRMASWKGWPLAEEISVKALQKIPGLHVRMNVSCLSNDDTEKTEAMFSRMKEVFKDAFIGKMNVPFEEMQDLYYNSDVYILTSDKNMESFGRTLVEAMSRNTAVLTTPAGGSEEVVGEEENVCSTAEAFVERLVYWNENPDALSKEKERCRKRVIEKYSLSNNIKKHDELYIELKKAASLVKQ